MSRVLGTFISVLLVTSFAHAGQVLVSCDLSTTAYSVDDIEIKKSASGMKVEVFEADSYDYYSEQPITGTALPSQIDLSGFSAFTNAINPRLYLEKNVWYFEDDSHADPLACTTLK
jgi:hypothetical protein